MILIVQLFCCSVPPQPCSEGILCSGILFAEWQAITSTQQYPRLPYFKPLWFQLPCQPSPNIPSGKFQKQAVHKPFITSLSEYPDEILRRPFLHQPGHPPWDMSILEEPPDHCSLGSQLSYQITGLPGLCSSQLVLPQ